VPCAADDEIAVSPFTVDHQEKGTLVDRFGKVDQIVDVHWVKRDIGIQVLFRHQCSDLTEPVVQFLSTWRTGYRR
jgi:hypothetical protein